MVYDAMGRLLQVYKTLNNDDGKKELIVKNSYDALGQLSRKELGHNSTNTAPLETLDYTYNIRGWFKGINGDYATHPEKSDRYFGEDLSYDWGFTSSQFNGNISGQIWRSKGDGEQRAYGYSYDVVNRLAKAEFSQNSGGWSNTAMDFTVLGGSDGSGISYDENGNILTMLQKGIKGTTANATLDALHYSYYQNSNKLKQVTDENPADNKLGDFHYDAAGKTAIDYGYDRNGNMVADMNKKIGSTSATNTTDGSTTSGGGIVYNLLNLPAVITTPKGTITYQYDAAGNKLRKTVSENLSGTYTGQKITTTVYIGGFVYESLSYNPVRSDDPGYQDRLQFFPHEEGRVRPILNANKTITGYTYDYMVKDHLGNVRALLTEESKQDQYPAATMEDALASTEEALYANLNTTRSVLPNGYPVDNSYSNPNNYVAKVGGANSPKIGPSIVLKVMAGDKFNLKVSSWYKLAGTTPSTPVNPLNDLVNALITGIPSLSGKATSSDLCSSGVLNSPVSQFLSTHDSYETSKPKAYVNWLLLDEQFHFVAASSGAEQVGEDGQLNPHQKTALSITKNGYLYVYVSNETPNIDVFFDNLQVTHVHGPLLEETHYYPFGLTMAGISSKAVAFGKPENKKGFNGNEIQNKEFSDLSGLEVYDFNARTYDPQTGRFIQIDPLVETSQESLTPYQFGWNDPVRYNDPSGKFPFLIPLIPIIGEALTAAGAAVAAYFVVDANKENIKKVADNISDKLNSVKSKQTGSYTNTHDSGNSYHGKGSEERAKQSAKEKEKTYNDPVKSTDWKPAKNEKEAFKDEARRIRQDGGVENPKNYNKINSPGEKELKKEDAQKASSANQGGTGIVMPIIVPVVKFLTWLSSDK